MKKYILRTISIVSIFVLSLFLIMCTQNQVDHNTLRIKGFYQEERDSIDVILFGGSEVFTGYSPGYAYDLYGYTSYSYAIDANYTELFKSQIGEALSYQTPKCILIETSSYYNPRHEDEKPAALATIRKWTDGLPLSSHKIEIINQFVESDKLSYYFPFIMYHGLLSNYYDTYVNISQRIRGYSYLKGITTNAQKTPVERIIDVSSDDSYEMLSDYDDKVFRDLLVFCKTLDCKVVFVRFPHRITNESEYHDCLKQNYIESLVNRYGFDFINFDKRINNIRLSPNYDFYGDSHMNINGQEKFTRYLGSVLEQNYEISQTELSNNNKKRWKISAEYTELFYEYYHLHEDDKDIYAWYETPELIKELNLLRDKG